jgi:Tol biopolymer transport system component
VQTGSVAAQSTVRVNIGTGGAQGNAVSGAARISYNGTRVAYTSFANNLVTGDTNGSPDIFLQDLVANTITRVSVDSSGNQVAAGGQDPDISGDGRYVVFDSSDTTLVSGDTNAAFDIFMHDTATGVTTRVSVDSSGTQSNGNSFNPAISADGRYVAFQSVASNLVTGDTNGTSDIFVHDNSTGATVRVNVDSSGNQAVALGSGNPRISGDGNCVCFQSNAANLVPGDNNGSADVFVHDMTTGTTDRASVDSNQNESDLGGGTPDISYDGQFVVFGSSSTNLDLITADTNGFGDAYLRDRNALTTIRLSIAPGPTQGNQTVTWTVISADASTVAFSSQASNMVAGDTNGTEDIFVVQLATGAITRESVSTAGVQATGISTYPSISTDGRFVCFQSSAGNLVAGDTNGQDDVFQRDRATTQFVSFCSPGLGGVMSCPCSNPPAGAGTGCDNSAATGGAQLTATGTASIANDNLVFTATGEKPTAGSEFIQGTGVIAGGAVFGQGVRCVSGTLLRLYLKTAAGGVVTAPDVTIPDPTVSARSSALGDTLAPGMVRYYYVFYRDPTILGGCPATSGFNATQAGSITWAP